MFCEQHLEHCHETVIQVSNLSKCYCIYERPIDRLKQMLWRGRRRYYREFWALQNVSFNVQRGQTVGVIGRNGSGKSTLLKLLCGTLNPSSGTLQVRGKVAALLELGSGFNPEFTGRENIQLNAAILGLNEQQIQSALPAILQFADIGDFIEQPVKTYSSGMAVRLAFAIAAHVNPDILVIDEALAVGDIFFVQKCMRFLRQFQAYGTLLFVSHDTTTVMNLCNQVLWLEHGQVRAMGEAKAVCESYLAQRFPDADPEIAEAQPAISPSAQITSVDFIDQRLAFINRTNLRNDLEVFTFRDAVIGYGTGAARIVDVRFLDEQQRILTWIVGGELVTLVAQAKALTDIHNPIIGFFVKDRLGQQLFGDNTYLTYAANPRIMRGGECLISSFTFRMPVLPPGDYTVDVAIAAGSQAEHITHCWSSDVLAFKSHASSVRSGYGLVAIPMLKIELATAHYAN